MIKKMVFVFCLQLISLSAYAGTVICDAGPVDGVIVTGERSDSSSISNKLFVILNEEVSSACITSYQGGYKVKSGYIENTSPSYNSMLSIASLAFATQRNMILVIDDTEAMNGVDETGAKSSYADRKSFKIESIIIR
jgi:hypothetical protein